MGIRNLITLPFIIRAIPPDKAKKRLMPGRVPMNKVFILWRRKKSR